MADSKKNQNPVQRKPNKGVSDAQILARLRRRKSPATATELGLPSRGGAERLRNLDGVIEVHKRMTGNAGRPASQFVAAAEPDHGQVAKPTQAERDASDRALAEGHQ